EFSRDWSSDVCSSDLASAPSAGRPAVAANSRYTPPAPRVEADAIETVTVDWDGLAVEVPASVDDWDPDILEAFEQGKAITVLRMLLGSLRYDGLRVEWKQRHGRAVKLGDLTRLFDEIARTYGFDGQGE